MSVQILAPGAGLDVSRPFKVRATQLPLSVTAYQFAGAEEAVIQIRLGDGTYRDLGDTDATMTSASPDTSITSTGTYKVVRDGGTVGVSIGTIV